MANLGIKFDSSDITIEEFIKKHYREYWEYSNKNGKNAIDAYEQLPEVVRKIIYAAYTLNIRENDERKTTELSGQALKFHAHGDASMQESIKGVATAYKSQAAARLLYGIGNFGSAPGEDGAAGRYTSISGTPLLTAIYKDIRFVPMNSDDTGLEQPEYISCPLPMALINGASSIGTGKSCYIAERDAKEIIKWIDALRKDNWDFNEYKDEHQIPAPMSVTGCETWIEPSNGYVYYQAVVHKGVDPDNLSKKGRYDVITALPPKSNAINTIDKLRSKLPTRVTSRIIDGSGEGRPTWIIVPTGYLDEADYNKYSMRSARKEQIYIWDHSLNTMRGGTIIDIAKDWFEDRSRIVAKRLGKQVRNLEATNHSIDLIKLFAENKMINWKSEEVIDFFVKFAKENDYHGFEEDKEFNPIILSCEEAGERDANLVLSKSARTFLPENLEKNQILRDKNLKEIKDLKKKIKNVGDVVISEAFEIIEAQEKFFENKE